MVFASSALVRLIIRACVREIMSKGSPLGSPWTLLLLGMKDVAAKHTLCPAARGDKTTRAGRVYPQHMQLRANFPK